MVAIGSTEGSRTSFWPAWVVLVGVLLVVGGVALNENGVAAGRSVLATGLAIAAVGVGLGLWWSRRTPPSPTYDAENVLHELAERRKLQLREDGSVLGRMKTRRVEARGEGDVVHLRACFKRALDLGLTVHRGRPPGDVRRETRIGDMTFDNAYTVRADEPLRAEAVLSSERLRALLLTGDFQVDDEGVTMHHPPAPGPAIDESFKQTVQIAREVERASGRAPGADYLTEKAGVWADFAATHHLATAASPLAMWGSLDGLEVSARAVRDAFRQVHFEVEVDFPAPLGRGLEVKPASSSTQLGRTGGPVGHPAFDKWFGIKCRDSQDATKLVGATTRELILELREAGVQLRISDRGLWAWIGYREDRHEQVPEAIVGMAAVAKRIADNAQRYPARDVRPSPAILTPSVPPPST